MEKIDVYKVVAGIAAVAVISWIFSLESLFLLGALVTLALGAMCGVLIGIMVLSERVSSEFVRDKAQWKNVEAGARVSHR